MSSDFPQGLLELLHLLEVFFITLSLHTTSKEKLMSVELVLNSLKRRSPMLKLIKVFIEVNNGNTKVETLNLFEVNCKDAKKTLLMSFWCL